MPFFDSNKIIAVAKNVKDETLINEEIAHIVPIDASGNLVTYLTTDNPKKITNIKIIFKNGAKAEYNVTYDKTYDMVADYKIKNLNIDYVNEGLNSRIVYENPQAKQLCGCGTSFSL